LCALRSVQRGNNVMIGVLTTPERQMRPVRRLEGAGTGVYWWSTRWWSRSDRHGNGRVD